MDFAVADTASPALMTSARSSAAHVVPPAQPAILGVILEDVGIQECKVERNCQCGKGRYWKRNIHSDVQARTGDDTEDPKRFEKSKKGRASSRATTLIDMTNISVSI